jgi:Uma2 family endonuclease
VTAMAQSSAGRPAFRYVREVRPLHFPEGDSEGERVIEGKEHYEQRTLLYQLLKAQFGATCSIGSDQFVYFHASDPSVKVGPDLFVKLNRPDDVFPSWKTWERGTPELVIEVVSPHENFGRDWENKLDGYYGLGVQELVRFDPDESPCRRLRVWDRLQDDLVERLVEQDRTACVSLGAAWVVQPGDHGPLYLRLEQDGALLPTPLEAERAARRREREEAAREREAAERRIAELEAELARRR